ncbi:iron ABC transporter permease [Shimia sp. R11_0]|uniref:FecCD family ABC transporter permease n=1 Tax=Shimia sp. R11_0 TaxID=2821096 RepID=UPI001ADAB07E|nr:iron ABC transporter permease [Shimia sp. R11_0]MBO9476055.1 iron ABC transporter permease [Shimia sp. R11_0]
MRLSPAFPTVRMLFLVVLTMLAAVASLRFGAVSVAWSSLLDLLTAEPEPEALIVMTYRAPRTLAAVVVGLYLGCAGMVFQTVLRNPLADPTLFGVSGGAGLAVVGALSLALAFVPGADAASGGMSYLPMAVVPVIALIGAFAATALVLALSGGFAPHSRFSPVRMILTGVIVSAVLNAIVMALVLSLSESRTELAILWLSGSLYGRSFDNILPTLPWGLLGLGVIWGLRSHLSVLRFDVYTARGLGIAPGRSSLLLLAAAAGLAANAVAVAGTVGFVGLIVPHIARRILGPDVGANLMGCGVIGALLVCSADVLGRSVAPPLEVPVGMMTSLLGAPVLAVLIRRMNKGTQHA